MGLAAWRAFYSLLEHENDLIGAHVLTCGYPCRTVLRLRPKPLAWYDDLIDDPAAARFQYGRR